MSIKYRPSLSLDEIQFILTHPAIAAWPELESKLRTFTIKAKHGLVKPSHVLNAPSKGSITDELGFSSTPSPSAHMDSLLKIYNEHPDLLTPSQLADVMHHRYIHDLMSPDEEQAYEGIKP